MTTFAKKKLRKKVSVKAIDVVYFFHGEPLSSGHNFNTVWAMQFTRYFSLTELHKLLYCGILITIGPKHFQNLTHILMIRIFLSKTTTCQVCRGVTRLDGARGKKHVRTWGLSEGNVLYSKRCLWHYWDFSAPPAVIRRCYNDSAPGNCSPLLPLVTPREVCRTLS